MFESISREAAKPQKKLCVPIYIGIASLREMNKVERKYILRTADKLGLESRKLEVSVCTITTVNF